MSDARELDRIAGSCELGTQLWSSLRTERGLNYGAISLAPQNGMQVQGVPLGQAHKHPTHALVRIRCEIICYPDLNLDPRADWNL